LRGLLRSARRRLYIDPGDTRRTVLLAGSGRSGTTWVANLIDARGDYRILFEPFHPQRVHEIQSWSRRQYLRLEDRSERFLAPAHRILSGRIRNAWVDQQNERHLVRRRLVKDIRVNLALGWIRRNFPEIPIVVLLRHPCAVASSRLAAGWQTHLDVLLDQPDLVEDFLLPFVPVLRGARDDFERHLLLWCVENYVPLRQFVRGEIHVCFYEHFCHDLEHEMRALYAFLGQDFDPALLPAGARPSAMARPGSAVLTGGDPIDAWRAQVAPAQLARALELLELFGLNRIYAEHSLPRLAHRDDALSGSTSAYADTRTPRLATAAGSSDPPARP
jgi:hypothetical protein